MCGRCRFTDGRHYWYNPAALIPLDTLEGKKKKIVVHPGAPVELRPLPSLPDGEPVPIYRDPSTDSPVVATTTKVRPATTPSTALPFPGLA